MVDLTSRVLLVAKGCLFALLAVLAAGFLFAASPDLATAALVLVLAWSSARFYYFLFYVLERYVAPSFRYAGVTSILRAIIASRSRR